MLLMCVLSFVVFFFDVRSVFLLFFLCVSLNRLSVLCRLLLSVVSVVMMFLSSFFLWLSVWVFFELF